MSLFTTHNKWRLWIFSDEGCDHEQLVPQLQVRRLRSDQQLVEERFLQRSKTHEGSRRVRRRRSGRACVLKTTRTGHTPCC